MLSQRISTIYPPIDPRWFESAERVLKTGIMHNFDVRSRATGRWLNIRTSRVSEDLFQQTFVDVSDRHRLEEQRRTLLTEMNHRVMNNFQMVAGFLNMQARAADHSARAQLHSAERRVQVLAKLHSLLAYTESDSEIDAAAYVRELCRHLESMIERPEDVTLVCEVGELRLPTDKAIPLGFVVTELVANSAKYAYPAPLSGAIHVTLSNETDGWILAIWDHGQGMDPEEPGLSRGLGSRLVQLFTRQIGAQLMRSVDGGVRHEIRFSYPASAKGV
jgi:two-component sensor histidine kinase